MPGRLAKDDFPALNGMFTRGSPDTDFSEEAILGSPTPAGGHLAESVNTTTASRGNAPQRSLRRFYDDVPPANHFSV